MKRAHRRDGGTRASLPTRATLRPMRKLPVLILLALLALSLSACGNRGPLVLPSPDEAEIVPDDDPAPDPAESADEAVEQPPVDDANDEAGDEGEPETPPAGTPDRSGR